MAKWVQATFVVTGVVVVLFGVGGIGFALALENSDSFCASCHTQPEVAYYEQSIQPAPTTLAAFHAQKQTTCIDCHSGGGIFGRSQGLIQGGDDLVRYISGDYRRPAVTTNPLGDDSCTKCHGDIFVRRRGESRSNDGHYHAFLPRWQAVDPQAAHCTSCHPAHPAGTPDQGFMSVDQVSQTCNQCHAAVGEGE